MITVFICTATKCPNKGVEYNMEGEPATAMCGGCGKILTPTTTAPVAPNV